MTASNGMHFAVARYYPPGNVMGKFEDNVFPVMTEPNLTTSPLLVELTTLPIAVREKVSITDQASKNPKTPQGRAAPASAAANRKSRKKMKAKRATSMYIYADQSRDDD